MGNQRIRQWQRHGAGDDPKKWAEKHLNDHAAESSLRLQDFDHNRLVNLHQAVGIADSPTFVAVTLSGLTASKPVFTNGAKALVSTGTLGFDQGGTGLTSLGLLNTILGVNAAASALEYKSLAAGTGITVTPAAGSLTIACTVSTAGLEPAIDAGTTAQYWRGDKSWQTLKDVPSGAMLAYGGSSAPAGWLMCDGTSYLRADYAALFAVLGTTYGAADGDHFNVPDIREKYPRGKGGALALADTGGATTHTHAVDPPNTTSGYNSNSYSGSGIGGGGDIAGAHTHDTNIGSFTSGSGNSLDPYVVVNYIIKT